MLRTSGSGAGSLTSATHPLLCLWGQTPSVFKAKAWALRPKSSGLSGTSDISASGNWLGN